MLPPLLQSRGYLLCVASLAAAAHAPLMAPYAAAKAGVEALANSLRLELEGKGVDVGVAYFSFLDTDMVREGVEVARRQSGHDAPRQMARPIPLPKAVRSVIRGIEHRAQRVVVPRAAYPIVLAGELLRPLVERATRRQMGDLVSAAERTPERDPEREPIV